MTGIGAKRMVITRYLEASKPEENIVMPISPKLLAIYIFALFLVSSCPPIE